MDELKPTECDWMCVPVQRKNQIICKFLYDIQPTSIFTCTDTLTHIHIPTIIAYTVNIHIVNDVVCSSNLTKFLLIFVN